MAEDLDQLRYSLERVGPSVRCVFTTSPDALPLWVERLAERASQPFTVVCIRSVSGAGLAAHLDQAVQVLAEAVLLRHPLLGCSASEQLLLDGGGEPPVRGMAGFAREGRRVPAPFWRRTLESCQRGQPPRNRDYPLIVEAECLASCLDPRRLVLLWVMPDPSPSESELFALARGAEWLATSTHASVLVAVSARCRGRSSLDPISYAALSCEGDLGSLLGDAAPTLARSEIRSTALDSIDSVPDARSPPIRQPADTKELTQQPSLDGKPRLTLLWPFIGQPHPLSPAEQLFAELLAADAELSGKFAWNQVVATHERTRPIVDLLWPEGRLVVEIDGFIHHRSRLAFEQDRQRDWELLVSGYRVLRLPASEVLRDPRRCLEKLRALERRIAGEL